MTDLTSAIASLCPNCAWRLHDEDYSTLEWEDSNPLPKPTLQQLEKEVDRLKTIYENNEYYRSRAAAYPNIKDQLDMLWHAMDADSSKRMEPFYSTIKAVKDQFPKQ